MFTEQRISDFLDALASKEPVPGGGSGAALGGAVAAALVSMVCNLTLGKKGYEEVEEAVAEILERSEALRAELTSLLEADTEAYSNVMAAYRMPRQSAEEQKARQAAVQKALREATEVPLSIADRCARIVDLALPAAQKGNKRAVSDAGVAALLAEASMHASLLNVYINLGSINDREYERSVRQRTRTITKGKTDYKDKVLAVVHRRIGG
ncbi:MAG: cyclodeaminase/cyclohydrolase family protein [Chloroflexota bacterium]|nr:cyclodeaminase/cyclohydrolase family protein [Chloroflexota bacterium]